MPPDRRTRIERILEQQDADLQLLEDREVEAFLAIYELARLEMRERLDALERTGRDQELQFTAQHLRVMIAQVEAGTQRLEQRLGRELEVAARRAQERALGNLLDVIKAAEPNFRDTGARIEQQVLRRFSRDQGLLVHRYSTQRYAADVLEDIQRELRLGVATGKTIPEVRDRIFAETGSRMSANRYRAELIARMETNSAYNQAHQEANEEAAELLNEPSSPDSDPSDPLMKKADEFRDLRNHALSRVLDGQVVPANEPFRVRVVDVKAEHAKLQAERAARNLSHRSLSGVVWAREGGLYVGMAHPAHFGDRGRQVPWRMSWGEGTAPPPLPRPTPPPGDDAA